MWKHNELIKFYLRDRIERLTLGQREFCTNKSYGNFVLESKLVPEGYEYNVQDIKTALGLASGEPDPEVYERALQKQLKNKHTKEKKKMEDSSDDEWVTSKPAAKQSNQPKKIS